MLCDEARELIVAYLRQEASEEESAGLEEHLSRCEACAAEAERARRMLSVADAANEHRVEERILDLLRRAIAAGASDVHVDPEPEGFVVRFRSDGVLKPIEQHPRLLLQPFVDRLLRMAGLPPDVTDAVRRRPAEGRIWFDDAGRQFELRLGVFPMLNGPKVVLRVMPAAKRRIALEALGFRPEDRQRLEGWVQQPSGLVLIVGPPGAGKTTTLYALLGQVAKPEVNAMSVEGHVEATLPNVQQAAIRPEEGITYASALRTFFQFLDPDVVMVGDVPDSDTGRLLPDLAITGHLVLAGFRVGDTIGAVRRLLDLGADPFTLAATLRGVCAQRLPRRICPHCRTERAASSMSLQGLGIDPATAPALSAGAGCEQCRRMGFRGRVPLFELLEPTPALAQRIAENAPAAALAEAAGAGLTPFVEDARRKVLEGVTTAEEALRVIRLTFA
jgi:type II secretory ATPase GspE/PulE/Tfp pilus assembly ATPase PilB-like protein